MNDNRCSNRTYNELGLNVFFPGTGSCLLGVGRIVAFGFLRLHDSKNRYTLKKKTDNELYIARGLVLPSYFPCIYFLMALDFIAGILNVIFSTGNLTEQERLSINAWIIPIEYGLFHWIYEGLALFLVSYGGGWNAFRQAMRFGLIWGIFTTILGILEYRLIYKVSESSLQTNGSAAYGLFTSYYTVLLVFYGCLYFLPLTILYRRPAVYPYAAFNILLSIFWITVASFVKFYSQSTICGFSVVGLILIGLFQPLFVWYTLLRDSQYWQGMAPDRGNPMSKVWDQIDIVTAQNDGINFVAGGFSRVYFGYLRNERVALKVMMAMELTSEDVVNFFNEAKILHALAHENVIECKGVCVMPPAVGYVLEYCSFGSLFDFLYKNKTHDQFLEAISIPFLKSNPHVIIDITNERGSDSFSSVNPMNADSLRNSARRESYKKKGVHPNGWGLSMTDDIKESENVIIAESIINHPSLSVRFSERYTMENDSSLQKALNNDEEQRASQMKLRLSALEHIDVETQFTQSSTANHMIPGEHTSDNRKRQSLPANQQTPSAYLNSFTNRPSMSGRTLRESITGTRQSINVADSKKRSDRLSNGSRGTMASMRQSAIRRLNHLIRAGLAFGSKNSSQQTIFGQSPPVNRISYMQRHKMMLDVIRGIAHLHSNGYMHSDIKSLNFLVTSDLQIKLSDMGETRHVGTPSKREQPPIPAKNWAPPEVLAPNATSRSYTMRSDIYGMAIVLTEMLTLSLPFGDEPELCQPSVWYKKLAMENLRPKLPETIPIQLRNVIESAWSTDPLKRPTADTIYELFDAFLPSLPSETI